MTTKVFITGAKGRMGQCLLQCAEEDPNIEVAGMIDKDEPICGHLRKETVVVDFTVHTATPGFVEEAVKAGCPVVIGTTGFSYSERNVILQASKAIPIVLAPNMSVGVNLLFILTQVAASGLKDGFDVEIIEKHHRMKKDSPSGTAARLAEVISNAKGKHYSKLVKHGRYGELGERTADEIGVHSIRGGSYVGEHTVIFAGTNEILEITHKAGSRDIFAKGALMAAKWVASAGPGLYDMPDVLGLQVSHQT